MIQKAVTCSRVPCQPVPRAEYIIPFNLCPKVSGLALGLLTPRCPFLFLSQAARMLWVVLGPRSKVGVGEGLQLLSLSVFIRKMERLCLPCTVRRARVSLLPWCCSGLMRAPGCSRALVLAPILQVRKLMFVDERGALFPVTWQGLGFDPALS